MINTDNTLDLNIPQQPFVQSAAPVVEEKRKLTDKHIWGVYLFLVAISLIELYSASSREVASSSLGVFGPLVRHGSMLFAGFLIMIGLQRTHYIWIYRATIPAVMLSLGMMVYVLLFGEEINGAKRAFTFIVTIQPAEFLKITAALFIAWLTSRNQLKDGKVTDTALWGSGLLVLIYGGLLITQGLTNTLLLMAISVSMMIIGGIGLRQFLRFLGILAIPACCLLLLSIMLTGSRTPAVTSDNNVAGGENGTTSELVEKGGGILGRFSTWTARLERHQGDGRAKYEQEINATNRQEMYAFMAQAHGGLFGVGPGNSRETARLPLAFSDYIYSIIIEEWGLVGGLFVLLLYLWLLCRAAAIAGSCARAYPSLLVLSMALMIGFQALAHMAIVSGFAPVSGQPLPLLSKGGTSILVTSIALGIMLSVSRHAVRTGSKKQEIKAEVNELPEEIRGENHSSFQKQ